MKNERLLPAYPLFVKDPYFSIWSEGDVLNDIDTAFQAGKAKKTYGFVKANGKTYCFLGNIKSCIKLNQTGMKVTTFRTIYEFECDDFNLELAFFSPMPVTDYKVQQRKTQK